jgi:hypothetical protein
MNAITRILLATGLGILAMLANTSLFASDAPDISGSYLCHYSTPPSSSGTETLIFTKNGDAYIFKDVGNGVVANFIGTAIFNKDINNAFGIVYWNIKDPSRFGNELMTIQTDGSFEGVFIDFDKKKPSTESCTKSS